MVLHSPWARLNVIFTYGVTCLALISGLASLSLAILPSHAEVSITNPEVLRMRYVNQNFASGEQAFLQFDIDADLTGLWNWNVKQLFVFLVAEYKTKHSKLNQAIIWDTIIQEEEMAHIDIRKENAKYPLVDVQNQLRKLDVNLTLRWDIMPFVGPLRSGGGQKHNVVDFRLPKEYL